MDAILHIFGVCGDAPVHLDLLDVFLIGAPIGMYVKWKWYSIKSFISGKFRKR